MPKTKKVTTLRPASQLRSDLLAARAELVAAKATIEALTMEKTRLRVTTASLMTRIRDAVQREEKVTTTLAQNLVARVTAFIAPMWYTRYVIATAKSSIWYDIMHIMRDHSVDPIAPSISKPVVTEVTEKEPTRGI